MNYRLNTTIDVDERQYSSQVTWTNSFSQRWIQVMNSAGCRQSHGTVPSFRLSDNRVVLVGARICSKAMQELSDNNNQYSDEQTFSHAMSVGRTVNVMRACPNTFRMSIRSPGRNEPTASWWTTRTGRRHGFRSASARS
jgi:hypothetical protein